MSWETKKWIPLLLGHQQCLTGFCSEVCPDRATEPFPSYYHYHVLVQNSDPPNKHLLVTDFRLSAHSLSLQGARKFLEELGTWTGHYNTYWWMPGKGSPQSVLGGTQTPAVEVGERWRSSEMSLERRVEVSQQKKKRKFRQRGNHFWCFLFFM